MEFYERLFQALRRDDIKEFKSCMETNYCGSLRLGRFPVLSVMYLYNSRRLLRVYEKKFLKHNSWQDVGEPPELGARFRGIAGKCLRLYLNETVSPLEMLLLLDRNPKLKRVFSQAHITAPVKQRLKDIYYIRWGLQADFVRGKIVLERRPLTRSEKWQWFMRAVCAVMCLAIIVSAPFVVNVFSPFITDGQGVLNVSRWSQIRFNSDKVYVLQSDITAPKGFFANQMNCELRGNGHTVTVQGDGVFGDLNGKLSDITFETNGSPIAESVALQAEVDNVTVNVDVNMQTDKAIGFFATDNYSQAVSNVTVNVKGSLTSIGSKQQTEDETEEEVVSFNCGGIVANNNMTANAKGHYYAILKNCTVNYSDFSLKGSIEADAAFGGIVGTNDGIVEGCLSNGAISADTFDVAGICAENNYWINTTENKIDIKQSSDVAGWNPLAAGIVLFNYFVVDQCVNSGSITCVSTAGATTGEGTPCAYAAGIAYRSVENGRTVYLQHCTNNGDITASATRIDASASGVCSFSNGYVSYSVNEGNISASGTKSVEVAGITSLSYGYVVRCVNNGKVAAKSEYEACVGGIVGTTCLGIYECLSTGSIEVEGKYSYVGGILGCSIILSNAHGAVCGEVESCIASCEITVKKGAQLDVGGIVGFVQETLNGKVYTLAKITYCYFTGKFQVVAEANLGAIAGVVGEKVYKASESAKKDEDKNFLANFYVDSCGVSRAFGAAIDADNHYVDVSDLGANKESLEKILNDETYKEILKIIAGKGE